MQKLAATLPAENRSGAIGATSPNPDHQEKGRFDLLAYLAHYGVEVIKEKSHAQGMLYCLAECLFDPSHRNNEAALGQTADGKLYYQCFHNSCRDHTWAEAREAISHADSLAQFVVGGTAASAAAAGKRRSLRVVCGGQPPGAPVGATSPRETPPATEGFSWSNLGNARRLVALHGADLHYNHLHKRWYIWSGRTWAEDQRGEIVGPRQGRGGRYL